MLNLVVRRVDFPHELETIAPFVSRLSRLRSFRVEFPRTENVHENGFIQLYKAIGNCSQLRSFEWKGIEMAVRSPRFGLIAHNALQCLKWLKNYKVYDTLKKGALVRNHATESEKSDKPLKQRNTRKRVTNEGQTRDLTFFSTGEWADKEVKETVEIVDKDMQIKLMKKAAQMLLGLEKMRFLRIKTLANFEEIVNFFTYAAYLTTLTHLETQYLNCQISDMEVLAFADGLPKAKQLKYFSLKVIQKPGLSEECIKQLAGVLSKLDNLLSFDVYFRRLGMHPQGIKDLGNRIQRFRNMQCCCSKESIHIYRRSDTEE